jgi:hypothetical protein
MLTSPVSDPLKTRRRAPKRLDCRKARIARWKNVFICSARTAVLMLHECDPRVMHPVLSQSGKRTDGLMRPGQRKACFPSGCASFSTRPPGVADNISMFSGNGPWSGCRPHDGFHREELPPIHMLIAVERRPWRATGPGHERRPRFHPGGNP